MSIERNGHLPGQAQLRGLALLRYLAALERGDADTLGHVLQQAERDPALMELILAANDAATDAAPHASDTEIAQAQAALRARFPALAMLDDATAMKPDRLKTIERDEENDIMSDDDTRAATHSAEHAAGVNSQTPSIAPIPARTASRQTRPNRWLRLGQALVAALVVAALVGGFFTVLRHLGGGVDRPTVPSSGTTVYSPAGAHEVVVGSWIGEVWALDPATGKPYWKFTTGDDKPVTSILIRNGIALVGDAYRSPIKVFAVQVKDGKLLWKHAIGAENGFPNYMFANQDTIFLADASGTYAFRVRDGKQLWHVKDSQPIWAANGVAFLVGGISNLKTTLLAIRASDGKQLWSHAFDGNFPEIAQVVGQKVYAGYETGSGIRQPLLVLNLTTGQVLATESLLPDNFTPLTATGSQLIGNVFEGSTSTFYSYSLPGFKRQWNAPDPYFTQYGAAAAQQDNLYISYQAQQNSGITPGENTSGVTLHPTYHPAITSLDLATGHTRWNWVGPVVAVQVGNSPSGDSSINGFALLNIVGMQSNVYSTTEAGVFALDGASGKQLWRFNAADDFVTLAAV